MNDVNHDEAQQEHNEAVAKTITTALDAIDGSLPTVDVLEGLAIVISVCAKNAEMSPAKLVSLFAQTVDVVYAEEEITED